MSTPSVTVSHAPPGLSIGPLKLPLFHKDGVFHVLVPFLGHFKADNLDKLAGLVEAAAVKFWGECARLKTSAREASLAEARKTHAEALAALRKGPATAERARAHTDAALRYALLAMALLPLMTNDAAPAKPRPRMR